MSVKDACSTAQDAIKKAKEELDSFQIKHDTLEGRLVAGFNKVQATWKEEKEALQKKAKKTEKNRYKIRLTEAERAGESLAVRDASSAHLRDVVAALRKIIRVNEEVKEKVVDKLTTAKRVYKQAQSGLVSLCSVKVSELRGKL